MKTDGLLLGRDSRVTMIDHNHSPAEKASGIKAFQSKIVLSSDLSARDDLGPFAQDLRQSSDREAPGDLPLGVPEPSERRQERRPRQDVPSRFPDSGRPGRAEELAGEPHQQPGPGGHRQARRRGAERKF